MLGRKWVLWVLVISAMVAACGCTEEQQKNNGSISSSSRNGTLRDAAGLLRFRNFADPAGNLLAAWRSWNPCNWKGVTECVDGRVTKLILENMQLNGTFADDSLNKLDQLRVLSLKRNRLLGPVPDLTGLNNLKSLFLDHNLFTGPIPESIPGLRRIRILVLSDNFLSGDIPDGFASVQRLAVLLLDKNRLEGPLPAFNQSSLKYFNVSYNQLSGQIPSTTALDQFSAVSFAGNPRLCGKILNKTCKAAPSAVGTESLAPAPQFFIPSSPVQQVIGPPFHESKHRGLGVGKVVGIAVGSTVGFAVILCLLGLYCRKDRRMRLPKEDVENYAGEKLAGNGAEHGSSEQFYSNFGGEAPMAKSLKAEARSGVLMFCGGEAPMYTLDDLLRATAEIMGRGTVGTTYRASMDNKMIVTVKRLKNSANISRDEFERHMEMVGKLRHQNIVALKAYFQAKEERLLVYEHYSNGSLFYLLHGPRSSGKPLHWTSCFKIAEDVANGLAYLHQASRLSHGNLKSSNVLLGADFEACITDYGLTIFESEKPEEPEALAYKAPECIKSDRKMGPKSDVYSFGVLVLELLTGKVPMQSLLFGQPDDLQRWVKSMREAAAAAEPDSDLNDATSDEKPMILFEIAITCLSASPERRPTMRQVLRMIEDAKDTQSVSSQSTTDGS